METVVSTGVTAGEGTPEEVQTSTISRRIIDLNRGYQRVLDKWNPHVRNRWIASSVLAIVFAVRILYLQGFFIIAYALGIYLLNLLIGFLSPKFDPDVGEGPTLPTRSSDEFRPFVRRLPEFKLWYSFTQAFIIAFILTFFSVLDVPVFWPILLIYWVILFIITMRKQISLMIKHKYVPFSFGKKTYGRTSSPSAENVAS